MMFGGRSTANANWQSGDKNQCCRCYSSTSSSSSSSKHFVIPWPLLHSVPYRFVPLIPLLLLLFLSISCEYYHQTTPLFVVLLFRLLIKSNIKHAAHLHSITTPSISLLLLSTIVTLSIINVAYGQSEQYPGDLNRFEEEDEDEDDQTGEFFLSSIYFCNQIFNMKIPLSFERQSNQ